MANTNVIGIPLDDKAFEERCIVLFAGLLKDPDVKLVGTRGVGQSGLDLIGRRDRDPDQPVGIQCKLISRGGKLSPASVRAEVTMALKVKPHLTEYYIVTTARDDPALDGLATELAQEQKKLGRKIIINVWGWDTLQEKIRRDPEALRAFDPDYSASTRRLTELGEEAASGQTALLEQSVRTGNAVAAIQSTIQAFALDTQRGAAFEAHLDNQIDEYRELMNRGKPRTALGLLDGLQSAIDATASASTRARLRANRGIAHLRLGDHTRAAELIGEAYVINPSDPKVRANRILALALGGDREGALAFAREVLAEEPDNAGAAALLFQVAAFPGAADDPHAVVPEALLADRSVRLARLRYLRIKGDITAWRAAAAEALEEDSDDGDAIQAAGDALLDEALEDFAGRAGTAMTPDKAEKLRRGAALLQRHWDEVRFYENAGELPWAQVGCNLITAYRALGSMEDARRVRDQLLAVGGEEPEIRFAAAHVAMEDDNPAEVVRLLRDVPESAQRTMILLAAWSQLQAWPEIIAFATPERRALLDGDDSQALDSMLFRARHATDQDFDLDGEAAALLAAWPNGVGVHVVVADTYRRTQPERVDPLIDRAVSLLRPTTIFPHRVMLAQLCVFRERWDDVVAALDGYVSPDQPSEQLEWLAVAFANATVRPRTRAFFAGLPDNVIAIGNYARLAGAAEHARGDLRAAERHLRVAIGADPTDLRAHLLLASTLERDGRRGDVEALLDAVDAAAIKGSPADMMRLAMLYRRHDRSERALDIGYRTAAANRGDESVAAAYPALIFFDERLPEEVGRTGPIAEEFWFKATGADTADVEGVITRRGPGAVQSFAPDHPLAALLIGKSVGDTVTVRPEVGPERSYTVAEIKHKCLWLLHDIMATHAARFPQDTSMVEVRMKEGDVKPVLDIVRKTDDQGRFIVQTYLDAPVPAALIAAMAMRPTIAFVEHLANSGENLRTCVGTELERSSAAKVVRRHRGRGAVLDTITFWFAHRNGLLDGLRAYFGRLAVARSTVDELVELRGRAEFNRGREYMTLGFDGSQPWRRIHTPEETEAEVVAITEAIQAAQQECEVMADDGGDGSQLAEAAARVGAAHVADPVSLARNHGLLLLSDDMPLRQMAAMDGVRASAWLQVALAAAWKAGDVPEADYLRAVGMLAAMRHDHVWLDSSSLTRMLTTPGLGWPWFKAASEFIGGPKADPFSHVAVVLAAMAEIWRSPLPRWEKGRACGQLLTMLIRKRPEWEAMLRVLDHDLAIMSRTGAPGAAFAREYLLDWMRGHFIIPGRINAGWSEPTTPKNPVSRQRRRRAGRQ